MLSTGLTASTNKKTNILPLGLTAGSSLPAIIPGFSIRLEYLYLLPSSAVLNKEIETFDFALIKEALATTDTIAFIKLDHLAEVSSIKIVDNIFALPPQAKMIEGILVKEGIEKGVSIIGLH